METLWKTQRRSAACGLLSGVFLVTAVVLSRRISGDAAAFASELAACLTGIAASLIAILAASLPDLISDRLARPQRSMLISACGMPGIMLGLAVMPVGSTIGLSCLLGLYVAAVLTVSAFEAESSAAFSLPGDVIIQSGNALRQASKSTQPSGHESESHCNSDLETEGPTASVNEPPIETLTLEERLILQASKSEVDSENSESAEGHAGEQATSALPFELNEPLPHPSSNPDTTQWMSRSRVDGTDVAEGSFKVRFAAGQRLAPVHLPFSPPLTDAPEFECEPADGSDLRFRTTAVHAYGIRIEVSRSGDCSEAATVEAVWMASSSLSDSVAA